MNVDIVAPLLCQKQVSACHGIRVVCRFDSYSAHVRTYEESLHYVLFARGVGVAETSITTTLPCSLYNAASIIYDSANDCARGSEHCSGTVSPESPVANFVLLLECDHHRIQAYNYHTYCARLARHIGRAYYFSTGVARSNALQKSIMKLYSLDMYQGLFSLFRHLR